MKYVIFYLFIGWYGVLPSGEGAWCQYPASGLERISENYLLEGLTGHLFSILPLLSYLISASPSHRYLWIYLVVLKSFLVYVSDIFSATTMLTTNNWSNEIFTQCQSQDGCFFIPFSVGKWLFVGCIIFSFLLVGFLAFVRSLVAAADALLHIVGIRGAKVKKNHRQSRYLVCLHQCHGQSLLLPP